MAEYLVQLRYWKTSKMADILQTTFSDAFPSTKVFDLWLTFQWSLLVRVKLTISLHGSCSGLAPTSHYLHQWWPRSITHVCGTRPQWVNSRNFAIICSKYTHRHGTETTSGRDIVLLCEFVIRSLIKSSNVITIRLYIVLSCIALRCNEWVTSCSMSLVGMTSNMTFAILTCDELQIFLYKRNIWGEITKVPRVNFSEIFPILQK